MGAKGGGGGGGGGKSINGTPGIPAEFRKMVQSLKEIVNNCTDQEIYATLKECNMDPDEAVNRLLTQDTFHEVKSKREKKKEIKDSSDSRSRGPNIPPNRTSKGGGADRYVGRGSTNQFGFSESASLHGKSAYKKENGANDFLGSSSASGQLGNHTHYQFPSHSSSVETENKLSGLSAGDGISSQASYGYQSTWLGSQGQVSMADIVKMGKPQGKSSSAQNTSLHGASPHNNVTFECASSFQNFNSAHQPSTGSEIHTAPGMTSQHESSNDEWPLIEPPQAVSISSAIDSSAVSDLYSNPANLSMDGANQHVNLDQVQGVEIGSIDTIDANHAAHASALGRNTQEDNSGGASVSDGNLYDDMGSYLPHRHAVEHSEADDGVSSIPANFQQLSLQNEDEGSASEEENSSVVIPHHLQLHTPDCFHLSFGSFGTGTNAAFTGSSTFSNIPPNGNKEETSASADVSPVRHSESRNSDYYEDATNTDGNLIHRTTANAGYYETPATQAEVKQETSENTQANVYSFPSPSPAFSYESNQPSDMSFIQNSSEIQNLERAMLAYTNTLSNNMLLASNVQTVREDPPYSPFPDTQSVPKYSNVASSITGPSISMPEVLRTGSISTSQPTPQSNIAAGPALPQHLAVHPYSQPTLPLGHFANMIGYPFLPQSYTYMPSGFQQAFAGNNTYHQALAAVLPQYKNSISVSSLSQSAAIASGYGFGSSTSIPGGNFPLNPPSAPAGSTISYEDALSSQYKENNHLLSLQQNENPGMWIHGPGSRTMSAVPASAYYGLQGQNQQSSGFRQGQQPSQQFGALGYPNFYHSQAGISLDGQQQQNLREASHGGSQGQPPKQSQQLWQNSY